MAKKKVKTKDLKKTAGNSYLYPYLLLFFLTLVFYWDLIFSNKVLNAMDILAQVHYFKDFSRRALMENHSLPLWFPDIYGGMPSVSALFNFYPFSLLFLVFPVNIGINLFTAFHTFLAGAFMYIYVQGLGVKKFGSLISALTFMFSAYFISRAVYCGHEIKISTMVWIPLVFFFFDKGLKEKKISWFAFAGAAMGIELIAGHMQMIFYTGIALVVYAFFSLYWMKADNVSIAFSNPVYKGFIAMSLVFFMASAAQFIPALEYAGLSSRGEGTTYAFATSWSLPPEEMLTYLLPGLKGIKLSGYYGRMPMSQATPYIGVLPLMMAAVALIFRRDRYVYFLLTLCFISFFIALGKHNPFYEFIYNYVPGFNLFRVPQMILVLAAISLSALAGIGSDYLFDSEKIKMSASMRRYFIALLCLIGTLLLVLVVAYLGINSFSEQVRDFFTKAGQPSGMGLIKQRYTDLLIEIAFLIIFLSFSLALVYLKIKDRLDVRIIKVALVVVLLVDLWYVDYKFMETLPLNNASTRSSGVVDFLKKDKDYFRILAAGDIPNYPANKWSYFGIQSIAGYHAAPLGYYSNYMNELALNNSLPDLLNAKYIILSKILPEKILRNPLSGYSKYELVYNGEVKVYKNKKALPRAFIARDYKVVKDDKSVLATLATRNFPLRDTVLLTERPTLNLKLSGKEASADSVEIVRYSPDQLEIQVEAGSDGILVLNEVYYPGWKAYVDGNEVPVMKADYLLRAISLESGSHKVLFSFEPVKLKVGALLSLLAFFVIVPFFVWQLRKEPKAGRN